jgi:hypothetical protein
MRCPDRPFAACDCEKETGLTLVSPSQIPYRGMTFTVNARRIRRRRISRIKTAGPAIHIFHGVFIAFRGHSGPRKDLHRCNRCFAAPSLPPSRGSISRVHAPRLDPPRCAIYRRRRREKSTPMRIFSGPHGERIFPLAFEDLRRAFGLRLAEEGNPALAHASSLHELSIIARPFRRIVVRATALSVSLSLLERLSFLFLQNPP